MCRLSKRLPWLKPRNRSTPPEHLRMQHMLHPRTRCFTPRANGECVTPNYPQSIETASSRPPRVELCRNSPTTMSRWHACRDMRPAKRLHPMGAGLVISTTADVRWLLFFWFARGVTFVSRAFTIDSAAALRAVRGDSPLRKPCVQRTEAPAGQDSVEIRWALFELVYQQR